MQNLTNLYAVDTNLEVKSNFTQSYIPGGIHENIKLIRIVHDVSPSGIHFLAFYFEDATGKKLSHTEYPKDNFQKPVTSMTEEELKTALGRIDTQKRRVGQLVSAMIPREDYSFNVTNFNEFADKIVKILEKRDPNQTYRVKVVYNDNGYTSLPNYWRSTFIEPMTVTKEQSLIQPLDNIDRFVKPTPDVISRTNNPKEEFDVPVAGTQTRETEVNPDDLPF